MSVLYFSNNFMLAEDYFIDRDTCCISQDEIIPPSKVCLKNATHLKQCLWSDEIDEWYGDDCSDDVNIHALNLDSVSPLRCQKNDDWDWSTSDQNTPLVNTLKKQMQRRKAEIKKSCVLNGLLSLFLKNHLLNYRKNCTIS